MDFCLDLTVKICGERSGPWILAHLTFPKTIFPVTFPLLATPSFLPTLATYSRMPPFAFFLVGKPNRPVFFARHLFTYAFNFSGRRSFMMPGPCL